jgi:ADP-heptose:LPS heptosyltransferase
VVILRILVTFQLVISILYKKVSWHINRWLLRRLWILNAIDGRITVIDHFGTPGDTLLAATVCRIIKKNYPRLRINCATHNPDVLQEDPELTEINGNTGFCSVRFEYLGLVDSKATSTNVLASTLHQLGIRHYDYKARVYLTEQEREAARQRVPANETIISINIMSKELVKVWRMDGWRELVSRLQSEFTIIQVGDDKEPFLPGVISFGGKLTRRESMAVIGTASIHIGPDSFLMHAANGLDVPSVIIYGGSRPAACLGYRENKNLYVQIGCSPCWLHDSMGQLCMHEMECMNMISVDQVYAAVLEILESKGALKTPRVVDRRGAE